MKHKLNDFLQTEPPLQKKLIANFFSFQRKELLQVPRLPPEAQERASVQRE